MIPQKRSLERSNEYWERARGVIPCGTQTLSKGPDQFVRGVYPIYLARGQGSHVFDVDGNEYIDYPLALGAITLGYAYPAVVEAVRRQLEDGSIFTLMHPLEVELAEMLCALIPCAERVRFAKNGSDVTSAAVRVARAYTGREAIVHCGYHGWQDWYAVGTARDRGIPKALKALLYSFEMNRIDLLEELFTEHPGKIAAVILEHGVTPVEEGFFGRVKEVAHKNGALFIWDEVGTGFRYSLGGAQQYFGVTPDLACFGKGMANGMPLSALVGRREVMEVLEDNVFFSMTYGGETLSLAAAIATIREMTEKEVIPYLWTQGRKLQEGYNRLAAEVGVDTRCVGPAPRTAIVFRDRDGKESTEIKSLFMQECVKRGILFGAYVHISYSHTDEDIERTLSVCADALEIVKWALDEEAIDQYMEGEKVGVVFRSVR